MLRTTMEHGLGPRLGRMVQADAMKLAFQMDSVNASKLKGI